MTEASAAPNRTWMYVAIGIRDILVVCLNFFVPGPR